MSRRNWILRTCIVIGALMAFAIIATTASAVTTPNAGGDRTVEVAATNTFTGTDSSGTAVTDGWIFDGAIVDGNPVNWAFSTLGDHTVSYWADDGGGSNVSDTITVTVEDTTPPTANAGSDQSVDEDTTVNFDGTGSSDNDPGFSSTGRYYWIFVDSGSSVSLNGQTPSYNFATPGTYVVTLLVLDASGNFAADTMVVSVADVTPPIPAITGGSPQSFDEDTVVSFDASGTTDNDPNFAYTGSYQWDFTDGTAQTLTGSSASYTFAEPGSYLITLTVTDAAGNSASVNATFNILDVTDPVADWTISSGLTFDESVQQTLDGTASSDNVGVVTYEWTINDYGGSSTQYGSTTTYTWTTPGMYDVTLTAYDAAGNTNAVTHTVTVNDVTAPTAVIAGGSPQNYDDGATVTLDGTGSSDNDPNFASTGTYGWTISGPVSTSLSGASTSFTFNTPGTYTVTLYVTDAAGNVGSDSITVNIADITPPTVSISSGPSTLEQFYSADHVGSASDDVGVTSSGWAFTENSNPMNISGSTLSRAWAYTGTYTLTFWASDAAGNIATTSMSFTVTPDVTPPTVSISGPSTGDNLNANTYTGAIITELDPNCASSCTWAWSVTDRTGSTTSAGSGTSSLSYTFLPGRNVVTLNVTDPSGNTGTTSVNVDVDELVNVDTTWNYNPLELNWDVTISDGATLTISNSVITEPTLVSTATIHLTNGRLIFDNSVLGTVGGGPNGFVLDGTPDPLVSGPTMVMYFNDSTILGLESYIFMQDGTVSATNSNFGELRTSSRGIFRGVDTSFFMTNVSIDATGAAGSYGILSTLTSAITFGTTMELRLDGASVMATQHAIRLETSSLGGSVDVLLRDVDLLTTSTSYRGFYVRVNGGTGDYTFDLTRVDGTLCPGGTVDALFNNRYANVVSWSIQDSNLSATSSGEGMYFGFQNTAANVSMDLSNVIVMGSRTGMHVDVQNTQGGAPSWTVSNEMSITMSDVHFDQNQDTGLYIYKRSSSSSTSYANYLALTLDISSSTFNDNGAQGIHFYNYYGADSTHDTTVNHQVTLSDVQIDRNGYGFNWENYYTRANANFVFNRVEIDNNSNYGFRAYHYYYQSWGGVDKMGQYYFNFTDVALTSNGYGVQLYAYYAMGQQNFTANFMNVTVDYNRNYGIYVYAYYFQYYYYQGYSNSYVHILLNLLDSTVSHNKGSYGIYFYQYYCYGYSGMSAGVCMFHVNLDRSHVDDNSGTGAYMYFYYDYYNAGNVHLEITNQSSVDSNSGQGIYLYCYMCDYGYNTQSSVIPAELWVIIRNSSVSHNGGTGAYLNPYYVYYQNMGSGLLVDGSTFDGNSGDAIYFYHYYTYGGVGTTVRITNSSFTNNLGNAVETVHYYMYSGACTQYCALEVFDNNYFHGNTAEDIRLGHGDDYYRAGGLFDLTYTNNFFDAPAKSVISTYVTSSCSSCGYDAYGERFNFSGNTILNASGAPLDFELDAVGGTGPGVWVDFSNNYIADAGDTTTISLPGKDGARHDWTVVNNTILRNSGNALVLRMPNVGAGNTGTLAFSNNYFEDTGGTAFTLDQSNIQMTGFILRDSVFINQRKAIELKGVEGRIDNLTLQGSLQSDIELADGLLEVHNTPVDADKLVVVGTSASFNVYFHLKIYVRWEGSNETALGSIVEVSDALGVTFYVGAISDDLGIPDLELWSYSKSSQGILGRSPFDAYVSFFEIQQDTQIDLPRDRVVTVYLRDNIKPTLVVSTPHDGYATRDDFIQVEGTAYDSQSGYKVDVNDPQFAAKYVQVSSDNQTWYNAHIQSSDVFKIHFDYTLTGLTQDVHFIYIRVWDEAQNELIRAVPVTLDWTPPVVTLLEAVPSITNANTVHVAAETEVGAQVLVNGLAPPEIFIRPDGVHMYFQMDIPLTEGPNTVTVMAIDPLRNQGNASFFVLVDRQAPYLAVLTPEVDALVNSTTVQVTGQASDRNGVTVAVNGIDAPVIDGNFSVDVPLSGDVNRIQVIATDAAGNQQIIVRDVTFDNTPPWINVQSPANFALLGSPEVNVVGIVEPGSRLILNDELVDAPTGAFSRLILLQEGENQIRLVAIDPAGNVRTQVQTVTVDTVKPVITLTSPANETLWNKPTVTVTGNVSDDHSVKVLVDGAEILLNTDNTFSVPVALYEGTNFVTIEAVDGAGNTQTRQLTVIRDTTPPYVVPTLENTYLDGVITKTHDLSVTVSGFAERGSVVEACTKNVLGVENCQTVPLSGTGEFRTFVDILPLLPNDITVRATDPAGNTVSKTFTVTQEAAVPPPPVQTPVSVFAMFGVAIAALGVGAYLLMFSRRGRPGAPMEMAGPEPGYMGAPGAEVMAPGGEQTMVAPPPMAPEIAPEGGDLTMTADDMSTAATTEEGSTLPPDAEVPAAPSRSRPMRRRPSGSGEGGEGSSLTGMGAEDEAMPGESHQDLDENKEA